MPPKQAPGQRRVSSSLSKVSNAPSSEKASKSSKPTRIIRLKLPKTQLSKFPHEPSLSKSVPKKKSPLSKSTLAAPPEPPSHEETKSDSTDTQAPVNPKAEQLSTEDTVKKEPSSPKTGDKRPLGAGVEEPVKQRARPGPKKKPRNEDGTIIHTKPKGLAPGPAHKLGPKANQGAINAGLRALDRTGKPCKKWAKSGFHLKTFTGVVWELPTWRAPKTKVIDAEGEVSKSSGNSESPSKANNSNSNEGSEKSNPGDNGMTSSPAPAVAITA
ncbi:MAG: hypothetical protein Q9191_000109 [Dirinaria sp. TL-2023a]